MKIPLIRVYPWLMFFLGCLIFTSAFSQTQSRNVKALVGGTLIDGYGSTPLRNAHSHRPEEIRRGLQVGVDCFEHTGLATAPEYPAEIIAMIR